MKSDYKHWRNYGKPGDLVFITTTVLDFAHALRRPEIKDLMVEEIFRAHEACGAALNAFVVMSNHIHLLTRLSESEAVSGFAKTLKSCSARKIQPALTVEELNELRNQLGLSRRSFWQRSYRSVTVPDEKVLQQKARYIHENPVRAELVERTVDYKWSSAAAYEAGLCTDSRGLTFDAWKRSWKHRL